MQTCKVCPAGKYSWGGPYPPFQPEKATGVEDTEYKVYSFLNSLQVTEKNRALLGNQYLGERRCADYCCPTVDKDGNALNVSNIILDRIDFGTMPGILGKCALSPRCFPTTKAYLRNLKEEDEKGKETKKGGSFNKKEIET